MRSSIARWLTVVVLLVVTVSQAQQDEPPSTPAAAEKVSAAVGPDLVARGNLISNSGFEDPGAEGMPTSWFRRLHGAAEGSVVVKQEPQGYSGRSCLMLKSNADRMIYGAYSQPINLPPGTRELLISFYFKTKEFPQPDVYVMLFGTDFALKEWNTPYLQAEDHAIPQSNDWSLSGWRFRVVPGAIQAVVAFRGAGKGALYIDDVALRPYPQVAQCTLLGPGQVIALPRDRQFEAQVRGLASIRNLTATLQLFEEKRIRTAFREPMNLEKDEVRFLRAKYALDADKSLRGLFLLTGEKPDEVYDLQEVNISALIDGRLTRPAFRGTVLRSLPSQGIEATGTVNASEQLARNLQLSARLAGTDQQAREGLGLERPTPTSWRLIFDTTGLLTGNYEVQVTGTTSQGKYYQVSLPVVVAPEQKNEVGYNEEGILYISGRPILPRGVYFATTEPELENIKAAGFNFSVIPWRMASQIVMDKAAASGMMVMIHSRSLEYGSERYGFWEHAVQKFGAHPALLGWHTVGKPDAELNPPAVLKSLYDYLVKLDPHHPVMTSLTMPSLMADYAPANDIVMVWSDPLPLSGVSTVGMMLDQARAAVDPRPVWAIIQAVGHHWSWDSELDPEGDGRVPTPDEVRCMSYTALIHGARGLLYYAYVLDAGNRGKPYRLTQDAPALWTSLIRLNRELAWIEPLFVQGTWHPLTLSTTEPVHLAYWVCGDKVMLVAANTSDEPALQTFRLPPIEKSMLTNVFTGEKLVGSDQDYGMEFGPHDVLVMMGRLSGE